MLYNIIMFLDIGLVVGVAVSVNASLILTIVAVIIIAAVKGKHSGLAVGNL